MVMSTQTLDEAARLFEQTTLINQLQILNVGEPVTTGAQVTRSLTPAGDPVQGLVQSVTLENVVEGRMLQSFAIKVARFTALAAGQAVRVLSAPNEPALVGKVLLVETISLNGAAIIRKGTASLTTTVNMQGKEALS